MVRQTRVRRPGRQSPTDPAGSGWPNVEIGGCETNDPVDAQAPTAIPSRLRDLERNQQATTPMETHCRRRQSLPFRRPALPQRSGECCRGWKRLSADVWLPCSQAKEQRLWCWNSRESCLAAERRSPKEQCPTRLTQPSSIPTSWYRSFPNSGRSQDAADLAWGQSVSSYAEVGYLRIRCGRVLCQPSRQGRNRIP